MTSLGFNGLEFEVLHHDSVIASYAFSFSGIVVSGKLQTWAPARSWAAYKGVLVQLGTRIHDLVVEAEEYLRFTYCYCRHWDFSDARPLLSRIFRKKNAQLLQFSVKPFLQQQAKGIQILGQELVTLPHWVF
jgi:hypothetical protein